MLLFSASKKKVSKDSQSEIATSIGTQKQNAKHYRTFEKKFPNLNTEKKGSAPSNGETYRPSLKGGWVGFDTEQKLDSSELNQLSLW